MASGYAPIYDRVTQYASKVVSGEIVAGELHRLACLRHIKEGKTTIDEFVRVLGLATE